MERAAAAELGGLVLRYLAAYGPATVADVQTWCGLTRLREVVEGLDLVQYAGPDGQVLWDLPNAPLPAEDEAAPVRFLSEFDNVLLSYADRRRVMTDEQRARLMDVANGLLPGVFLVDGFLAGTWSAAGGVLTVRPWAALADDVVEEGERLLDLLAPGMEHRVDVVAPGDDTPRSAR